MNALKSYNVPSIFLLSIYACLVRWHSPIDIRILTLAAQYKASLPVSCSLKVKHVCIIPMYKSISSVWFTNIWNSHLLKLLDEARLWCSPHASFLRHNMKLHDAISSMFMKPEQILNSYVICTQEGLNCCVRQKNVWLSIKNSMTFNL